MVTSELIGYTFYIKPGDRYAKPQKGSDIFLIQWLDTTGYKTCAYKYLGLEEDEPLLKFEVVDISLYPGEPVFYELFHIPTEDELEVMYG